MALTAWSTMVKCTVLSLTQMQTGLISEGFHLMYYQQAVQQLGPIPALIEWDADLPPLSTLLEHAEQADAILEVVCESAA